MSMKIWPFWTGKNKKQMNDEMKDKMELLQEIKRAHREWVVARKHFDFVVDKEQIDYAIFALEAAEKRYEMLIRQAKRLKFTASDGFTHQPMGACGS